MTPEQQRIAIAQACGWTGFNPDNIPDCLQYEAQAPSGKWGLIPDYLNDLNAMRSAWLILPPSKKDRFESELYAVIIGASEFNRNDDAGWITNASAAQRAESFLRTIGKWVKS